MSGERIYPGWPYVGWCLFSVGPIWLLLWRALRWTKLGAWWSLFGGWLTDPEMQAWAANSATNAGLAVAINLAILRAFVPRMPGASVRAIGLVGRIFEALPPLALGVGALATPWLLGALGDAVGESPGGWLRSVALELSPGRSPGFLLILALACGQLPMLARVAGLARRLIRPVRVDA